MTAPAALTLPAGEEPQVAKTGSRAYKTNGEMRILFGEQLISDDLIAFLRRSACITERRTQRMLEVNPRQPLPHAARLEIEGLLRAWHRLHPDVVFTEHVPDEDLSAWDSGAVCLAWPSLYEGFGSRRLRRCHTAAP